MANSFYVARIILIPKLDTHTKTELQSIPLVNTDAKTLNKIMTN
jgi:hypothetical protein